MCSCNWKFELVKVTNWRESSRGNFISFEWFFLKYSLRCQRLSRFFFFLSFRRQGSSMNFRKGWNETRRLKDEKSIKSALLRRHNLKSCCRGSRALHFIKFTCVPFRLATLLACTLSGRVTKLLRCGIPFHYLSFVNRSREWNGHERKWRRRKEGLIET